MLRLAGESENPASASVASGQHSAGRNCEHSLLSRPAGGTKDWHEATVGQASWPVERQPPFRGPLYHLYEKELVSLSNSYAFQSTLRRAKPTGSALDERDSSRSTSYERHSTRGNLATLSEGA